MKIYRFLALFIGITLALSSPKTASAASSEQKGYASAESSVGADNLQLPSSVDLRKRGLVTAVKDQSSDGTCWAHAALGSIETANIKNYPHIDLSERYLAYYMETDEFGAGIEADTINNGSSAANAAALLTNWIGPVSESKAPYDQKYGDSRCVKEVRSEAELHVTGLHMISLSPYGSDREEKLRYVKQLLDQNRALYIAINFDVRNSLNYDASAYYYDSEKTENREEFPHAMLLVGYDDNYPAENFTNPPKNNGAWLIKNSWGLNNGDLGYYRVSYEDPTITEICYFDTESAQLHDALYALDDFGGAGELSVSPFGDESIHAANIFTAEESGYITDVMLDCTMAGDNYEITMYTELDDISDPCSGKAHSAASGVMESTGYKTISLNKPIHINSGEHFSVAANITGQKGYHAACELASNMAADPGGDDGNSLHSLYRDNAPYINTKENILRTFDKNQSFISTDGKIWTDLCSLRSETDNKLIGNLCLKALAVSEGAVHFSAYSETVPMGENIALSCFGGKKIFYSINGGEYREYSAPITFTGDMTVSAYCEGYEDKVYTRHYAERTAQLSSLAVISGDRASYADVTKTDIEITVSDCGSDSVTLLPIMTGTLRFGDQIVESYEKFSLQCGTKPMEYTLTVQEDGLLPTDYHITVKKAHLTYFSKGTWIPTNETRWYYFSDDKRSGYCIDRSDGSKTDLTYTFKDNRLQLKTNDAVYEGFITSNDHFAEIAWDDGNCSRWELGSDDRTFYTNPDLCEMAVKYCENTKGSKPVSVTAEFGEGSIVILTAQLQDGENIVFTVSSETALGSLSDGSVVNLLCPPRSTGVNAFKPGIWKSFRKDGVIDRFYYFDESGESGRVISVSNSQTFDMKYNLSGGQGKFVISYREDHESSEKRAVLLFEDSAVMTSEYGSVEYLSYCTSDTPETFRFYSEQELSELASEYCEAKHCLFRPFDNIKRNGDGTITVFESFPGSDTPIEQLEYYRVDIFTAKGEDREGNNIDLTAPEYVSDSVIKNGIWKLAYHQTEDGKEPDLDNIEKLYYSCRGYYWAKNDETVLLHKSEPSLQWDTVENKEYICRMTNGNGIAVCNGKKRFFRYIQKSDSVFLIWDKNDDGSQRIEKLEYLNDKTFDGYRFFYTSELADLAIHDCARKSGIVPTASHVMADRDYNVEIVLADPDTFELIGTYNLNRYTGEGTDFNGEFVSFANAPRTYTPTSPDTPDETEHFGDVDSDGIVTANDALTILRSSIGITVLTDEQTHLADVDSDGSITSGDALEVLRYSIGHTTRNSFDL